jgi:hypothetical protein
MVAIPFEAESIERWPLDRILEAPRNPRTHTAAQVDELAASMQEFGWTIPLLVDERGELIAGHGRLRAARQLGMEDAPVIVARGWSDAQKRAYRIADNKLALNAGWDAALLSEELASLAVDGFAIDLLGFTDEDMARLTDDTDRLSLANAAHSALQSDPTDWRHANASDGSGQASAASAPQTAGAAPTYTPIYSPPGTPPQGAPVAQLAVFSCMLTLADRPALFDAIGQARTRGAADSGAALVLIAREWLAAQTENDPQ